MCWKSVYWLYTKGVQCRWRLPGLSSCRAFIGLKEKGRCTIVTGGWCNTKDNARAAQDGATRKNVSRVWPEGKVVTGCGETRKGLCCTLCQVPQGDGNTNEGQDNTLPDSITPLQFLISSLILLFLWPNCYWLYWDLRVAKELIRL